MLKRAGVLLERVILHCDCNSFYASVELLSHPELVNLPVAVCGNPKTRHGIILAKNEHAKKYGIKTAQTVHNALKLCPSLQLLAPHHDLYSHYSKIINNIYVQFTDLVEPFGIDESWLDITGSWHLFGKNPQEVAHKIKDTVFNKTGLTISVGVSFNKIFAKLGSDFEKPNAVTVFDKQNYKKKIWPLHVGNLLYVGKSTQKQLHAMGITNIGQLAGASTVELKNKLGKLGPDLNNYARGLDESLVQPYNKKQEIKSIGNGLTFSRNLIGYDDYKAALYNLADEVASRLRKNNLFAFCVQLQIKDTNLKSLSRQKQLISPTCTAKHLADTALEIMRDNWDFSKPVRMLTLTAQNLTDDLSVQQLSLYTQEDETNHKRESLERSLDIIRNKYGKRSISSLRAVKNDMGLRNLSFNKQTITEQNADDDNAGD